MKKKYIFIAIIVLIVGSIGAMQLGLFGKRSSAPTYTTVAVKKGDIKQTVEATGSMASAQEIVLSFKSSGQITQMLTDVGKKVKKDDLLASIGAGDLVAQVNRARATVVSAQADLQRLLAGPTQENIKVAQQQVDAARIDLESAKNSRDNIVTSQTRKHDQYRDTALQSMTDAAFVCDYTLNVIYDAILTPAALDTFRTSDAVSYLAAQNDYLIVKSKLAATKSLSAAAANSRSDEDILKALYSVRDSLADTLDVLNEGFASLSGAIATSVYPQATIDTLKASFNARSTVIASSKVSNQNSINDLTVGLLQFKRDLDDAEAKVRSAETNVQLQESKLRVTIAKPQQYDIDQQRARVMQAEADLQSAESRLNDTVIKAPIDGEVVAVDVKLGETASLGQKVIHLIGATNLQIDVDIPESDINKVAVGQNVSITLDAFGLDKVFSGTVSFIEPSKRIIQDVVYYRVTVLFNQAYQDIKPGMTATIRIISAERTGVLIIPARSISVNLEGVQTVRVLQADGTLTIKNVTTGVRGDDGNIEIVSGLSEGDNVVIGEVKPAGS